jgi:septal ring factor EnvC (AmiA/AmiB activator)
MKRFLILSVCILIIISFLSISCQQKSLPEDLEKIESLENSIRIKDKETERLNAELEETKKALSESEEKQVVEEVNEESDEEEKSPEEIEEEIKDIFRKYIEEDLGGQLTKFVLDNSDENPENWVDYSR